MRTPLGAGAQGGREEFGVLGLALSERLENMGVFILINSAKCFTHPQRPRSPKSKCNLGAAGNDEPSSGALAPRIAQRGFRDSKESDFGDDSGM